MCNVGVYLRGDKRSITIIDYIDTLNMRRINMNFLIEKEEINEEKSEEKDEKL